MKIRTSSLCESIYLLVRAFRTRGMYPTLKDKRTIEHVSTVAKFSMSFMPGNRRTIISHGVLVEPEFRNKGEGRKLLKLREELAKEAGVNLLLATVKNYNKVEVHLLKTSGWKRFTNRRDTKTSLWGKQL